MTPSQTRARIGRWLLALTLVVSGLSLGAVHTGVLGICSILAAGAALLVWWDEEQIDVRPAALTLIAVAIVLVTYTFLQQIPLPRGFLATIAPANADVWARALTPLKEDGPRLATITLDPTATRVQILRGLTYLSIFFAALRVAHAREGVVFLQRAIIGAAVLVGGAALLHPAIGAHKVFGLYEPTEIHAYDPHHLGPLLNTNHLAAYTNIGALLAFAALISSPETLPRPLAAVVVVLLGMTTIWTVSRGGTSTLVVGLIATTVMHFTGRTASRKNRISMVAIVGGIVIASVIAVAYFEATWWKFASNNLFKLELVQNALELLRPFGVLGIGRGSFESVYPSVRRGSDFWMYTHPENLIAQWTTEWGVPIGAAALIAVAWALRPRNALIRSRVPTGAWGALLAVGLQNLVDYSSELPAIVIALAICAAMVAGGAGKADEAPPRRGVLRRLRSHPRALTLGLAGLSFAAVLGTVPFVEHELYNEERSFKEIGLDRSLSAAQFDAQAREVMLRHPAEAYFPFVGAVRATVVRDESVLPWAARALERSPVYGRVHLLLARALFRRNPSQARLEYRLACEQDGVMCTSLEEGFVLVRDYDSAMEMVPDGARGCRVLTLLAGSLAPRLPSTVVMLDRELSRRDSTDIGPVRRAAMAAISDVENRESWCGPAARAACVADGVDAATKLKTAAPTKCAGYALLAEIRFAEGEMDEAIAGLEEAIDHVEDKVECSRRLLSLSMKSGDDARIERAISKVTTVGCEDDASCTTSLLAAAAIEHDRGRYARELALTKKAWERSPDRDDLLATIGALAEKQSMFGEALDAYSKLADRHPEERKWSEAVQRCRAALSRRAFDRPR